MLHSFNKMMHCVWLIASYLEKQNSANFIQKFVALQTWYVQGSACDIQTINQRVF